LARPIDCPKRLAAMSFVPPTFPRVGSGIGPEKGLKSAGNAVPVVAQSGGATKPVLHYCFSSEARASAASGDALASRASDSEYP